MSGGHLHDNFTHHTPEKKASEKSLGVVFACVLALIGAVRLYHDKSSMWWFVVAGVFVFCAYFWQAPLTPLNRFWTKLGMVLFAITNPIIMGIIFFGTVMPTGFIMRAFGKDPLKMKLDKAAASYWIPRTPAGSAGGDMKNQF